MRLFCAGMLLLAVLVGTPAHADELPEFHAALETVSSHNRAALGYLRTENTDLALFELDHMRDAWSSFAARFGKERPGALRGNPLYATMLVDVPTRIVTARMMVNTGRLAIARHSLMAIRREISEVRRKSHIEVLADAVLDANVAMDALSAYAEVPPDWSKVGIDAEITAKLASYGSALARCDAMASDAIRADPEFRRLIDGAAASLGSAARAITTKDTDLLERVLSELRALDNLLAFRYG